MNTDIPIFHEISRYPSYFKGKFTHKVAIYLIGLTLLEIFHLESLDILIPMEDGYFFEHAERI